MDKDISKKCCKCEPYETGFIEACKDRSNCLYGSIQWDDKFGLVEVGKKEFNMEDKKAVIDGVGEDAEIITNAAGGKKTKRVSLWLFKFRNTKLFAGKSTGNDRPSLDYSGRNWIYDSFFCVTLG